MADMMLRDGLIAAAQREAEFHPTRLADGKPISAWERRGATLVRHADRIEALEARIAELEARPAGGPFPGSS